MSIAVPFAQNQNTIVYWVDAANRAATPQNSSRTMIPAHCRKLGASGCRAGRCPALVAALAPMSTCRHGVGFTNGIWPVRNSPYCISDLYIGFMYRTIRT